MQLVQFSERGSQTFHGNSRSNVQVLRTWPIFIFQSPFRILSRCY
jgi:hypothetical protein